MAIRGLNDFLSTEIRKKIFLYYVFSDISPSDIVDETKIPFSTVDRVTQLLKAHNILIESEGRDMRETKYRVDFDYLVKENLKFMGLDFIDEDDLKEILDILKVDNFFVLSYIFTNSSFVFEFFKEPLKIGDDIPFLILMDMNKIDDKPAQLISYILLYLEFSPLFKKLANDIENKFLDPDISTINKGIKKYTFIKNFSIDKDDLIEYEKKRAELILLMRKFFEKKIFKMSIEKPEKKYS